MKKIITFCFFAIAMVLGTSNMTAQSMVEINSLASKKTAELKRTVKFNEDTEDQVYKTFQLYEQKMYNINATENSASNKEKLKVEEMLNEKFETIFTPEEFKLYLKHINTKE